MMWELAASQWGWTPGECDELTDEEFAAMVGRLVDRKMMEANAMKAAMSSSSDTLPESIALAQMGVTPIQAGTHETTTTN